MKIRLHGSSKNDDFLYDSGAQVSLISKSTFRKIAKAKRPQKIDFNLTCSGVSGSKLKVLGCMLYSVMSTQLISVVIVYFGGSF